MSSVNNSLVIIQSVTRRSINFLTLSICFHQKFQYRGVIIDLRSIHQQELKVRSSILPIHRPYPKKTKTLSIRLKIESTSRPHDLKIHLLPLLLLSSVLLKFCTISFSIYCLLKGLNIFFLGLSNHSEVVLFYFKCGSLSRSSCIVDNN